MNGLVQQSRLFVKRNASTILTVAGGVGVVATTITAVKATPKAVILLQEAERQKGEKLTAIEKVQVAWKPYIPATLIGAGTIACIFGANVLNKRQQASLMSAYAFLDNSYKEYKAKLKEIYGEEADGKIREEIAKDKYVETEVKDGKELFYDEFSGRYFESTMEEVIKAEYEVNKKISLWGGAEVNEFYDWLKIPQIDAGGMGWSTGGLMAETWKDWLEFIHKDMYLEDGTKCCMISTWPEPMYDYEYY